MKRILVMTAVLLLGASLSFSAPAKSCIALDLGPTVQFGLTGGLGIGVTYEYAVLNFLSVEARLFYGGYSTTILDTKISLTETIPMLGIKYYPFAKALDGFWIGLDGGYAIVSVNFLNYSFNGGAPMVMADLGYKFMPMGENGITIEPYAGYGMAIGIQDVGGLDYGARLGWAF